MNLYSFHGLTIDFDFEIPFLDPYKINNISKNLCIDVTVRKNIKIINDFSFLNEKNGTTLSKRLGLILHNNNYFKITKGNKIEYYNKNDFSISFVLFILNMPFAYIFFQRKFLSIHGFSFKLNSNAVIICGDSKSGKSSIGLNIIKKNKLISEDISNIDVNNKKMLINSSYPIVLTDIKSKTFKNIKSDISRKRNTYIIPDELFDSSPRTVDKIVFNTWGDDYNFRKISSDEAFKLLFKNTFKPVPLNMDFDSDKLHFKNIVKFLNNVDAFVFEKPVDEPSNSAANILKYLND